MAKGAHSVAQSSTLEPSIAPDTIPVSSRTNESGLQLSAPTYGAILAVVLSAEVIAYYRFSNSTAILMHGGLDVRLLLITLTEWIRYMILGAAATTILKAMPPKSRSPMYRLPPAPLVATPGFG